MAMAMSGKLILGRYEHHAATYNVSLKKCMQAVYDFVQFVLPCMYSIPLWHIFSTISTNF